MSIIMYKLPEMKSYAQLFSQITLDGDISVTISLKRLFRDSSVLIDIYKDDISEETKIISGRVLKSESMVCSPNPSLGFNYYVDCKDVNGIDETLNIDNISKFYLQFSYCPDNKDWNLENYLSKF